MNFAEAFAKLVQHEGGFVNDRKDPGGATKFGISKAAYPNEDIPNMTLARAAELYQRDYWGPAGCDAMPDAMKMQVFDMAVNSGVKTAIRLVQKAIDETVDGSLGPRTLTAIQTMPPARLIARFNGQRLAFYAALSTWPAFGRGWAMRVADCLMEA